MTNVVETELVRDPRISSIGLVAPWLHDPELVKPYFGGDFAVAEHFHATL